MVLNTLSDTLALFKIDYELNKKDCTLAALMKDLQITKNILKKKNSTSLDSFKPNTKAKGKNNNNNKGSGSMRPEKKNFKKSITGKGKSFHRNENGHWKRNCKVYLDFKRKEKEIKNNKQAKNNLLFVEVCVAINSTEAWIIDLGATHHVCNSMQGLSVTKKFRAKEFTLRLGDCSRVEASIMGDITLNFNNSKYFV